jgi:hypothetical protein
MMPGVAFSLAFGVEEAAVQLNEFVPAVDTKNHLRNDEKAAGPHTTG